MESIDTKKAKTHKGRKHLDALKPKLVEDPKKTVFIKGNKTNETISSAMHDLYLLKKSNSTFLNERWDIKPFEMQSKLEDLCNKRDCAFYVLGLNSKKRPNGFYIGRLFDEKLLDNFEFEILSYKPIDPHSQIITEEKPCLIFQGDVFEYEANFMRIKNLFADFFIENDRSPNINIKEGIKHFLVITADNETNSLCIKQYELLTEPLKVINDDIDLSSVAKEIGPSIELKLRRSDIANDEKFKKACKQPKIIKDKHEKNIRHNKLGETRGRIFVERQNVDELALKKRKKLSVPQKSKSKDVEKPKDNEAE